MRRFLVAGLIAFAVSGCHGNTTTTPSANPTPTPTPTPSPVPTPTPVPPKSENYFPLTNQAAYEGVAPNGGVAFAKAQLATTPSIGTACGGSLATPAFGDFVVPNGLSIIPSFDIFVNAAYGTPIISKNSSGDVYVVGYSTGGSNETCVQPYPIAKAQMVKGTGWTFVDLAGVSRTASVVSDHVTATFTAQGPAGPQPTTYTSVVAQVSYGSDQTIYWAAGYGPVQVLNTFTNAGGSGPQFPSQWTAYNWTLDPNSK